jgi:hypothetical protein
LLETAYRKTRTAIKWSLALSLSTATLAWGQSSKYLEVQPTALYMDRVTEDLPDAPTPQGGFSMDISSSSFEAGSSGAPARTPRFAPKPLAPLYNKYIEPSQRAQPLTGFEHKFLFGLDQIVSPYFLVGVVGAAGYEHVTNGSPNYGTDKGAFGQRLGAAAIRSASQEVFSDGVMPIVFRQDPRYYVRGQSHNAFARGTYAISRVFITKTDSGANAPNYALFAGHAATAILENAYYPDVNHGVSETAKSYASSFAGVALSNAVREFFPDLLHLAHLE